MKEPRYVLVDTSSLSDGEFPNRWRKVVPGYGHRCWKEGVVVRHPRGVRIPPDRPEHIGDYFFAREILATAEKWPPRGKRREPSR